MISTEISKLMIPENISVIEAINAINDTNCGSVFICKDNKLLASLTDGDIRRYILTGKSLTAPASEAAHYNCRSLPVTSSQTEINDFCERYLLNIVPAIDEEGKFVKILYKDQKKKEIRNLNVPVVIMAGGKGSRLYPYTKILPKPLIPIGDLTITEHIIDKFCEFGCNNFLIIVNYKKEMIKAYFNDKNQRNSTIKYIDEDNFLGTGGGLTLLRGKIQETFFFTNCDIVILGDYSEIYDHHKSSGNILTMLCATKTFSFPYGTVDVDNEGNIISLQEKPSYSFLTNTGFYIIEPGFLDFIPDNTHIHITDIIQNCIKQEKKIGIYPISEKQWLDMGNKQDMDRMIERMGNNTTI
jgi:dTDP-glucose pyrophosphorylase